MATKLLEKVPANTLKELKTLLVSRWILLVCQTYDIRLRFAGHAISSIDA